MGPSGCGKTTLLRCILGRLRIDSGNILALGEKPGTLGHGVPGNMVGYMPQVNFLLKTVKADCSFVTGILLLQVIQMIHMTIWI